MVINRQTQIQIACILSNIFLESALIYKDNDSINEDLTKSYYLQSRETIMKHISLIKPKTPHKNLKSHRFLKSIQTKRQILMII